MPVLSRRRFATSLSCAAVAALAPPPARPGPPQAAGGKALIDLSSNENPYGPSPVAIEAMTAAHSVASRYPDAAEDRLREAIAQHHAATPEQIVLGCGSSEVLRLCDAAFLGPGRTVVAAEPTFEAVLHYAKVTRAESVTVPLDAEFRHDLRKMARACDARTGLVYVCNPNNPTGTIVRIDALTAFLEQVPKTAVVVVDEAYHHFVESHDYGSVSGMVARFPNLVVARTFSKIYGMAGMRLGYAVASAKNAEAMRAQASWSTVNVAVLEAGLACLKDPELPRQQRALLNGSRRALVQAIEKQGRRYIPSEANFLMIDVGRDVEPLIPAFAAKGIKVGRRFAAMPSWLRVTIGKPEETEAFYRALGELVPVRAAA
jgi:histidinol-phosphate aminotransferase